MAGGSKKEYSWEEGGFRVTNQVEEVSVPEGGPFPAGHPLKVIENSQPTDAPAVGEAEAVGTASGPAPDATEVDKKIQKASKSLAAMVGRPPRAIGASLVVCAVVLGLRAARRKRADRRGSDEMRQGAGASCGVVGLGALQGMNEAPAGPTASTRSPGEGIGDENPVSARNFAGDSFAEAQQDECGEGNCSALSAPPERVEPQGSLLRRDHEVQRLRHQLKTRDEILLDMQARLAQQEARLGQQVAAMQQQLLDKEGEKSDLEAENRRLAMAVGEHLPSPATMGGGAGTRGLSAVVGEGEAALLSAVKEMEGLRMENRRLTAELRKLKSELEVQQRETVDAKGATAATQERAQELQQQVEQLQRQGKGKDRLLEGYERERQHLTGILKELERKVASQAREIESVMRLEAAAADADDATSSNLSTSTREVGDGEPDSSRDPSVAISRARLSPGPPPRPGRNSGAKTVPESDRKTSLADLPPSVPLTPRSRKEGDGGTGSGKSGLGSSGETAGSKSGEKVLGASQAGAAGGEAGVDVDILEAEVNKLAAELDARYRMVAEKREETARLVRDLERHQAVISSLQKQIEEGGGGGGLQGLPADRPNGGEARGLSETSQQLVVLTGKLEDVALRQRVQEEMTEIKNHEECIRQLKARVAAVVDNGVSIVGPDGVRVIVRNERDVLGEELAAKLAEQEKTASQVSREMRQLARSLQLSSPYIPQTRKEQLRREMELEEGGAVAGGEGQRTPDLPAGRTHSLEGVLGSGGKVLSQSGDKSEVLESPILLTPRNWLGSSPEALGPEGGGAMEPPPTRVPSLNRTLNRAAGTGGGLLISRYASMGDSPTPGLLALTNGPSKEGRPSPLARASSPVARVDVVGEAAERRDGRRREEGHDAGENDGWDEEVARLTLELEETMRDEDSAAVMIGSPPEAPGAIADEVEGGQGGAKGLSRSSKERVSKPGLSEGGRDMEDGGRERNLRVPPMSHVGPLGGLPWGPMGGLGGVEQRISESTLVEALGVKAFDGSLVEPTASHGASGEADDMYTALQSLGPGESKGGKRSPEAVDGKRSPEAVDMVLDDMLDDTLDDMVRLCTPQQSGAPTPAASSKARSDWEDFAKGEVSGPSRKR